MMKSGICSRSAGGRPASAERQVLLACINAGLAGTCDDLAQHAGLPSDQVQRHLKELRRAGQVARAGQQRQAGHGGASRAVYAPLQAVVDALAHVRTAWR